MGYLRKITVIASIVLWTCSTVVAVDWPQFRGPTRDGHSLETGLLSDVGLVKIKPTGYEMVSSFKITKGAKEHWGHPAISDGRLYIRHGNALMCYDIKAK